MYKITKKRIFHFFLIILGISINLQAYSSQEIQDVKLRKNSNKDLDRNPYMTKEERKAIQPYLLPVNHPIKEKLDRIFSGMRVTLNEDTFAAAGFVTKYNQPRSYIKVASHPLLPGYLVKVTLDSELRLKEDIPSWKWFVRRIEGANKIRQVIRQIGSAYFTVPQKWIYPLPINPPTPKSFAYSRKNVILIVEDMEIVSEKENLLAWRNLITPRHLEEFYTITMSAGGASYRASNVPYTKKGKFAFIDTEYPYKTPHYHVFTKYLSPAMTNYWNELITRKKGGK